ncbi:MAG: hypothetical protein JSV09_11860 [Thermoplasmata archaeon]|nr:MAG: hypothetical protein JSV09_11860 [Thermoplasmata archaeon]
MTEELDKLLSRLTFDQIKEVAEKFGVDCSACGSKEEYITAISNSNLVSTEDLQASYGNQDMGTSSQDDSMPEFGEVERLLMETKSVFDSGDYVTAIDKATEAIDAGEKALNSFFGVGLSFVIRSTEIMISNLQDMDIDASSLPEILNNAKESHENQEYGSAGSIVGDLKEAMNELYRQQNERISELIEATQSQIDDAKELETDVSDAEKKLQEARDFLAVDALAKALESMRESDTLVKSAKEKRVSEVSVVISKAANIIEEASYLNAPVSEAEDLLESARAAFDGRNYNLALEKANTASEVANAARDEQIQKALSIQEKMKPKASEIAESEVPISAGVEEAEEVEMEFTTEVKKEEVAEVKPAEISKVCPTCGGDPTFVEQYKRHYCYTCSAYVEPVEKKEEVAAAKPAEVSKVCPTCGGDPTYVEQYKRHYCYTCSAYVEPVEKKEEVAEVKPAEVSKVCPTCGGDPTYVEQYKRHYCYTCSAYVEPVEKKKEVAVTKPAEVSKVCPTCGGDPTYVEQYKRHYCYTCSAYVEPVEKKKEAKPAAAAKPKEAKVCPTCSGEPTYVEQYKKYYCYTCSAYVEPVEKKSSANTCDTCGNEATYVDQYKRYYCYTCSKYV